VSFLLGHHFSSECVSRAVALSLTRSFMLESPPVCELSLRRVLCVLTLLPVYFAGTSSAQSPAATSDSASNSSTANSEKIYRAAKDGVSSPSCFYTPGPASTKEAQAAKFEGFVIADVVVTARGRIENIRIVKSPGLGLDDSVRETLGKWRCQPAKLEGKAVPVKLEFEFKFLAP